jgi:hypothetical protein
MSITNLDISEPFFTTKVFQDEEGYQVHGKSILLNLSERQIHIQEQKLAHLQSCDCLRMSNSTVWNTRC